VTSARITTLFTANCWMALHRYLGSTLWGRLSERCLVPADERCDDHLQAPLEVALERGAGFFFAQLDNPELRPQ